MEVWKPVLGYETLYEVSNFGNVRRTARGKKFTPEQIIEAKKMLGDGRKLADVAAFLNTSITTVFSIKHGKTWSGDETYRPLSPQPVKHYLTVNLCRDGVYLRRPVHRLVWEAFNGEISGRLEVNHKDLDRANNRLENLELLTHRENVNHAHAKYASERAHLPKGSRGGPRSKYAKIKHT